MPRSISTRTVTIPEIASSLKMLFVLRTVVAGALVLAGIACLYFGQWMLMQSVQSGSQTMLLEIGASFKLTAGGFGAVVMATSLVPFWLAYRARPTLLLTPIPGTAGPGGPSSQMPNPSIEQFA